jgi:hypothetical protein
VITSDNLGSSLPGEAEGVADHIFTTSTGQNSVKPDLMVADEAARRDKYMKKSPNPKLKLSKIWNMTVEVQKVPHTKKSRGLMDPGVTDTVPHLQLFERMVGSTRANAQGDPSWDISDPRTVSCIRFRARLTISFLRILVILTYDRFVRSCTFGVHQFNTRTINEPIQKRRISLQWHPGTRRGSRKYNDIFAFMRHPDD